MLLQRRKHKPAARHDALAADPFYGYGYNPAWPSILSLAHDPADGGRVLVITDRPCVLSGAPANLPLTFSGGGIGTRAVLAATAILPVKFRLSLTGPVPAGASWQWGTAGSGGADLVDPITNHGLNPAAGSVADVPGPYTPPPPAHVISTNYGSSGMAGWATLTFDQPAILATPSPTPDNAITFAAGYVATGVSQMGLYTLRFELAIGMYGGAPWFINRQPAWVSTAMANPQSGNF